MFRNLNLVAVTALILIPILMLALSIYYILYYQFGYFELILLLSGYYISNIAVGVGLHRLWSHGSYKAHKFAEFILILLSAGTLQGPALSWASNHFKHHTYTDTEDDPHSPLKYKENKILGFWWSHMGWMLVGEGSYKSIDKITMKKLGRNSLLRWQLKNYWLIAILMNSLVPFMIGYIFGGNLISAFAGFIFIGVGRALQQQATFLVNSLCHFCGTKKYYNGTAGDIWWLALFLLGENWHNFHHAFPSDYRNGSTWYHMDVHKWIIYLMSKVGLAWDLKKTTQIRVESKAKQVLDFIMKTQEEKLLSLKKKLDSIAETYGGKYLSNISEAMKKKFGIDRMQSKLQNFKRKIESQSALLKDSTHSISQKLSREIGNLEKSIEYFSIEFERKLLQLNNNL